MKQEEKEEVCPPVRRGLPLGFRNFPFVHLLRPRLCLRRRHLRQVRLHRHSLLHRTLQMNEKSKLQQ